MAVQSSVETVTFNPNGSIDVLFSDGSGLSFPDKKGLIDYMKSLERRETADCLILSWWQARDNDLNNKNLVEGKTLIFDMSSPNPIKVQ